MAALQIGVNEACFIIPLVHREIESEQGRRALYFFFIVKPVTIYLLNELLSTPNSIPK